MVETLRSKKENRIKKSEKNPRNPHGCIYIYIYIEYCHLENKKILIHKRDRAGPSS